VDGTGSGSCSVVGFDSGVETSGSAAREFYGQEDQVSVLLSIAVIWDAKWEGQPHGCCAVARERDWHLRGLGNLEPALGIVSRLTVAAITRSRVSTKGRCFYVQSIRRILNPIQKYQVFITYS
jgi:hypothetical protein